MSDRNYEAEIKALPLLASVNFRVAPDGTWHASVFTHRDNHLLSAGDAQSLGQAIAHCLNEARLFTSQKPAIDGK